MSPVKVWLAVLPLVDKEVRPKLLVNAKTPSPPTVFFTTVICPMGGGAFKTLVKVQVVVSPATIVMTPGVPLVHVPLI
jgi:hypothetical protein